MGKIEGGQLQCAYHGFEFDGSGACVRMLSQAVIPRQMRVRAFPVMESNSFIWVWPGDPELADTALVPNRQIFGDGHQEWFVRPIFMRTINSNYSMLFENLLDVTHFGALHGYRSEGDAIEANLVTTEYGVDSVRVTRVYKNEISSETTSRDYAIDIGELYERVQTAESYPPNLHIGRNVFTFPRRPNAASHVQINIEPITPASTRSHHFFLSIASTHPNTYSSEMIAAMAKVFDEDKMALEAVQECYDRQSSELVEVSAKADEAALRARQIIARLVAVEEKMVAR
jgi:vanillate O-demethylase monooxygenase subunit